MSRLFGNLVNSSIHIYNGGREFRQIFCYAWQGRSVICVNTFQLLTLESSPQRSENENLSIRSESISASRKYLSESDKCRYKRNRLLPGGLITSCALVRAKQIVCQRWRNTNKNHPEIEGIFHRDARCLRTRKITNYNNAGQRREKTLLRLFPVCKTEDGNYHRLFHTAK